MDNQEKKTEKLLEKIKQNEQKMLGIIDKLEKEVHDLKRSNLKKEMLLEELQKIYERDSFLDF